MKEALEESNLLISVDIMNWEEIPENFRTNIKQQYVVLQGKKELTDWREVRLGDVAELSKTSWKIGDKQFPYIGLEHINQNKLRLNSVGNSNSVASNKYRFNAGDILFGKLRPYFRKVVLAKFEGISSTDIWVIKPKGNTNNIFLFYFFANTALVDISYSSSSGTRMPRADWKFLSETLWNLPPLPEQKAIAEILSSLDDKIDLLHRQNKTLEDMAQTLFRQWFIEQANAEWEERPLKEVIAIAIGRTPPRKESQWFSTNTEDIKWISIKDMASDGVYTFNTSECLTQKAIDKFNIPVIPNNTVILSFKMTLGRVKITTDRMLSNEAIAHFKFGSETPFSEEYLYLYLKNYRFESLGSTSSIVTAINSTMIKEMLIIVPNQNTMDKFKQISKPLFEKVFSNQLQISTLENLRDTLLPKLMSGEVRINQ